MHFWTSYGAIKPLVRGNLVEGFGAIYWVFWRVHPTCQDNRSRMVMPAKVRVATPSGLVLIVASGPFKLAVPDEHRRSIKQ
jgi:hypothetical protein